MRVALYLQTHHAKQNTVQKQDPPKQIALRCHSSSKKQDTVLHKFVQYMWPLLCPSYPTFSKANIIINGWLILIPCPSDKHPVSSLGTTVRNYFYKFGSSSWLHVCYSGCAKQSSMRMWMKSCPSQAEADRGRFYAEMEFPSFIWCLWWCKHYLYMYTNVP